jgi:hypothetical protein
MFYLMEYMIQLVEGILLFISLIEILFCFPVSRILIFDECDSGIAFMFKKDIVWLCGLIRAIDLFGKTN